MTSPRPSGLHRLPQACVARHRAGDFHFANYLLFFWIFWRLPRQCPRKSADPRTLLAAIGFEVIKIVMTYTLPSLVKSLPGAAFGSVLG